MGEIKQPYERIAKAYAIQINNGLKTIEDVPEKPSFLKLRVMELVSEGVME